jgi:hypothetical protein
VVKNQITLTFESDRLLTEEELENLKWTVALQAEEPEFCPDGAWVDAEYDTSNVVVTSHVTVTS